jgi:hypothetical protein
MHNKAYATGGAFVISLARDCRLLPLEVQIRLSCTFQKCREETWRGNGNLDETWNGTWTPTISPFLTSGILTIRVPSVCLACVITSRCSGRFVDVRQGVERAGNRAQGVCLHRSGEHKGNRASHWARNSHPLTPTSFPSRKHFMKSFLRVFFLHTDSSLNCSCSLWEQIGSRFSETACPKTSLSALRSTYACIGLSLCVLR